MTTEKNLTEPVVIERTVNAPVERVWKALTDVDEMRRWYFDLKEFKPEDGFEFEFTVEHKGVKYHHLCKIIEGCGRNAALVFRPQGIQARGRL